VAYAFDTLGYAKTLRGSGVPIEQAEAHAEAGAERDFVMVELVTKTDLESALDRLPPRLTVRLGGMIAIAIAALAAIIKLWL
jgi:hypothetical protein